MKDKRICPQCSNKSRSDYTRFFLKRFIDDLNINMKIIDLGCGKGRNIYYLKEVGFYNITAIDILEFKELENEKINYIRADLSKNIPVTDKFNIILCNYILMFLKNREKIIREITDIADKKAFCIVELNPKKLSNGTPYDFTEIINFFSEEWDIVNLRLKENKFIAKKRDC